MATGFGERDSQILEEPHSMIRSYNYAFTGRHLIIWVRLSERPHNKVKK